MTQPQRIYLAGKVGHTDWRQDLCAYRSTIDYGERFEVDGVSGFPLRPILVMGIEAVSTGPVPIGCDHGCFHGENRHGLGVDRSWDDGSVTYGDSCGDAFADRATVRRWCEEAIQRSTAVFAWIEDQTCFGTLVELGFAKAAGKPIFLAAPPAFAASGLRDLWFAVESAERTCFTEDDPIDAFRTLFVDRRRWDLRTMPYGDYLQTPEWRARREGALERAGSRCQLCNDTEQLNVHHRTYERRGAEMPDDLTVLCRSCHSSFHGRNKEVTSVPVGERMRGPVPIRGRKPFALGPGR